MAKSLLNGSKAKIIDLIDSSLSLEFKEMRTEENFGLYATDLAKSPSVVAQNIMEGKGYTFQNFAYEIGNLVEYKILQSIEAKNKETEAFEFMSKQYKIVIKLVGFKYPVFGKVDGVLYKNFIKYPIEIKTVSNSEFTDEKKLNMEEIQLLAYIYTLNSPFGTLIRVNRDNGLFRIMNIDLSHLIYSPVLKTKTDIETHIVAFMKEFENHYKP